MTKYYKVLTEDLKSCNGGNSQWTLGEWMPEIEGNLELCENGYHLCRREDLAHWLGEAIFEAEYDGEIIEGDDKVVVRKARITRRIDTWTERTARLFACDCAERALELIDESDRDQRSIDAIAIARRFANGEATREELAAARDAAWDAVDDAWGAAWDAAGAAARAAAGAAARDAAWAPAWEWQTDKLFEYLEE